MKKTKLLAKVNCSVRKGKSKVTIKLLPSKNSNSCGSHGHK